MISLAGNLFETVIEWGRTGLVGTIGVRVIRGGSTVVERTTAGVAEYPAGSAIYQTSLPAPSAGLATIVWDDGQRFDAVSLLVLPAWARGLYEADLLDGVIGGVALADSDLAAAACADGDLHGVAVSSEAAASPWLADSVLVGCSVSDGLVEDVTH